MAAKETSRSLTDRQLQLLRAGLNTLADTLDSAAKVEGDAALPGPLLGLIEREREAAFDLALDIDAAARVVIVTAQEGNPS